MLIKAWCYNETCILGTHRGLISTYALEILVLYIFNIYHDSLNGPLAVSYGLNFGIFLPVYIDLLQDTYIPKGAR